MHEALRPFWPYAFLRHPGLVPRLSISSFPRRIVWIAVATKLPTISGGWFRPSRMSSSIASMPNFPRQQAHWPQTFLWMHLKPFPFSFSVFRVMAFLLPFAMGSGPPWKSRKGISRPKTAPKKGAVFDFLSKFLFNDFFRDFRIGLTLSFFHHLTYKELE